MTLHNNLFVDNSTTNPFPVVSEVGLPVQFIDQYIHLDTMGEDVKLWNKREQQFKNL